jgi:hypothetical protein
MNRVRYNGCIHANGHKIGDQLANHRVVFDLGDDLAILVLSTRCLMQQSSCRQPFVFRSREISERRKRAPNL